MLSEGGIVAKAQNSKEKQEVAVWLDRLTVTEANTAVTHYAVDMEKYNAQLKTEGIVLEGNSNYLSEDGGVTYNLTTDNGYVFNISEPTPGDIVINYIGKNGQLKPYIKEIKVISTTTNLSKIEVDVARLEDGKLTYEYKKHTEESYTLLKESKELTAEFTELTQNETYDIKVTAENKNGKSEAKIISIYTGKLEEGTISQKGETAWSAGAANIELQTTDNANTMQYQKNGIDSNWTNYTGTIIGLAYGDIIYARMFDGVNGTSPFSLNITDDVQPQTATISLSSTTTKTDTPITATVTHIDNESGVDINKCKWVYNTTSTLIGTDEASYTGGTFSINPQTISLNATTAGTYSLHVLTVDKAGNKVETVSNTIVVSVPITNIKAGDWIAYTGGGYSSWRVLWEANNSTAKNGNSIQIISMESVKDITLGSSDFNTSKNSYNSAITTLNNEAMAYVNSAYASDARCVGSVPNNKNAESEYFIYSDSWFSSHNGQFKDLDVNCEKDYRQMNTLTIANIKSEYWLASRTYYYYSSSYTSLSFAMMTGGAGRYDLCYVNSEGSDYGFFGVLGFRPVVSLKSNIKITGGNGTQSSPWQLGI